MSLPDWIAPVAGTVLMVLGGIIAWLLARIDHTGHEARRSIAKVHARIDTLGQDLGEVRADVAQMRGCLAAQGAPGCRLRLVEGAPAAP